VGDLPGLDPADRLTLARRLVTESVAVVPDA
jgi:bifunctional lysine-specific demethylase and histidyl-hydroxylase NO66